MLHLFKVSGFFFFEMATPRTGKDLLELRVLALLASHDVKPATMDVFGDSKVKTLQIFKCLTKGEDKFRSIWEKVQHRGVRETEPIEKGPKTPLLSKRNDVPESVVNESALHFRLDVRNPAKTEVRENDKVPDIIVRKILGKSPQKAERIGLRPSGDFQG